MSVTVAQDTPIERLDVSAYTIPTDRPEADGTLAWDATTLVLVEAHAGGHAGLGWTYGPAAIAALVRDALSDAVLGGDALDVPAAWAAAGRRLRNAGSGGLGAYAVAAVDVALWDLKARLLDVSLASLLGRRREAVPVYGSGGFTTYDDDELAAQLGGWVEQGLTRVKMKVGSRPGDDPRRVGLAREVVGDAVELMVDGNGAWTPVEARAMAERFAEHEVGWFEEPVSSDDLAGLRYVREHAPTGMAVAAGEYAADAYGFRRLLDAGAVDVVQGDVTRCGGISGLMVADALCCAHARSFSAHCAPTIHAHACAAMQTAEHIEWFHDHARIEALLFAGAPQPAGGALRPDPGSPGLGVELKRADAERWRAA
jgi:L-alanine-DL-glutamate epimerase-like enolase superfamily enzyme